MSRPRGRAGMEDATNASFPDLGPRVPGEPSLDHAATSPIRRLWPSSRKEVVHFSEPVDSERSASEPGSPPTPLAAGDRFPTARDSTRPRAKSALRTAPATLDREVAPGGFGTSGRGLGLGPG